MHLQWTPLLPFPLKPSVRRNVHARGVESKAYAERFEGAFFCAPEQSYKAGTFCHRGLLDQRFLVNREIVGDEGIATQFDQFQIAAEGRSEWGHRAQCGTVAVTE